MGLTELKEGLYTDHPYLSKKTSSMIDATDCAKFCIGTCKAFARRLVGQKWVCRAFENEIDLVGTNARYSVLNEDIRWF